MTFNIADRDRCFVIAEAGTCHAGPGQHRLQNAMRYVDAAANAGADAVKFQIFHYPGPETMFCWMDGDDRRVPRWRFSVMCCDEWQQVKHFAEGRGMVFLASTFEAETVGWLGELEAEATKVASRAAANFPYADAPPPYLVSLGMNPNGLGLLPKDAILMECESIYPSTLAWGGDIPGFSDHSGSPWRAIDAISRGVELLEVHFYIQSHHAGPDYPASLDLNQLALVCQARDAFAEL